MTKEKKKTLEEWYAEGPGPIGADQPPIDPNVISTQIAAEQPKPIEQPKPEDKEKKLDRSGEMFKAMVLTRAIEKKLVSFSYKRDEEDIDEAKSEVKDLVKKLGDIVNGL
jgi:hypothetical protein